MEGLGVRFVTPAQLAVLLRSGEVDAALVPIVEVLENPHYQLVDGIGIGCRGDVYSVFLAHDSPRETWRTAALDPDSRTSNQLARTLLDGAGVRFVTRGEPADAEVWIGDPAIRYREAHPDKQYLDLGAEWERQTGLPFVFAVWALRPGHSHLADQLRAAARDGLAKRTQIAQSPFEIRYLTEHIRYDVGPEQKLAIAEFARRAGFPQSGFQWV